MVDETSPRRAGVVQRVGVSPVSVAEVSAERLVDDPPEIPWHITPPSGRIALQLRSTVRRVAVGAGLARKPELIDAVRAIDGVPGVVTSPAGGTFIIGGDAWLGLCAIGVPQPGQAMPLDWMLHSLHRWFDRALAQWGVVPEVGRIEGAWCPGFSDITVAGRKLAGLGFRVTREWVVMRGVLAVPGRISDDALEAEQIRLQRCFPLRLHQAPGSIDDIISQFPCCAVRGLPRWRVVESTRVRPPGV